MPTVEAWSIAISSHRTYCLIMMDTRTSPTSAWRKIFDQDDPDRSSDDGRPDPGTPHYMSPEQADPCSAARFPLVPTSTAGRGPFSLLTGKPPIQGDSITQLLTQIVSPEPVRSPLVRPTRPGWSKSAANVFKASRRSLWLCTPAGRALKAWQIRPQGASKRPTRMSRRTDPAKAANGCLTVQG